MASSSFVLFGSGPGIAASVAKAFAQKHFDRIVLCARNHGRLQIEKAAVEEVAKQAGRHVQVVTFAVDLADEASLKTTLSEIERLGPVGMVYHNAARIQPAEPLIAPPAELHEDYLISTLALYIIAQWAIPLLKSSGQTSPSFFVTNSHFPESPLPVLMSLSLAKAGQWNMMMSLDQAFGKDVHFGLVRVCGAVAPENQNLNPTNIAKKAVELWEQDRAAWKFETFIRA